MRKQQQNPKPNQCPLCQGKGYVTVPTPNGAANIRCWECEGTGFNITEPPDPEAPEKCPYCDY